MQEERYVAIVDFGSSKVSLSVCTVSSGIPDNLLFFKQMESDGIFRGNIFNPQKVSITLRALLNEAQEKNNLKITQIVVNLPRWKVRTEKICHKLDRSDANSYITPEDIQNLKGMAESELEHKLGSDEFIYGLLAQSYSTDDLFQVDENDITGATGSFLEGYFLAFIGPRKYKNNIDRVLNDLNIACRSYEFTPIIESKYVLTLEEREHGVALIEIGASVTSVSVYHKGVLRYYGAFPFGGKTVTSDIHTECNIPEKLAENIKKNWGFCMPDKLQNMSEKIIQIDDPRDGEHQQLPVKYLSEIINCRMKEIISACMYLIGESGYSDRLRMGIILSGGASQIKLCKSLVNQMTGLPCRIAYPNNYSSPADTAQEAMLIKSAMDNFGNCAEICKEDAPERSTLFDTEPIENVEEKKPKETPPRPQQTSATKKKHTGFLERMGSLFGGDNEGYDSFGTINDNDE